MLIYKPSAQSFLNMKKIKLEQVLLFKSVRRERLEMRRDQDLEVRGLDTIPISYEVSDMHLLGLNTSFGFFEMLILKSATDSRHHHLKIVSDISETRIQHREPGFWRRVIGWVFKF